MREIKFRAWSAKLNAMVIPINNKVGDFLKTVEGSPIMQYTGLIDANHKEVYEGDILKITNPFTKTTVIKTVWWNGETARFNGIPTSNVNVFEVIGNIYENKDLLERT